MELMLKCKMCGGDLTLIPNSNLATCEYCGTTQTVPTLSDDKMTRLYNRANQYRMDCQFDKAYSAYEAIVNDKPDEAEAYWGMLLSEYGVEYVDDPKNGKKIPTCHRTLVRSITSNANYKAACQNADAESRLMYEDDAQVLVALQKRVLNASAKEEPYDVFICYKETDENDNRTPDSVMAQDIYDALTAKGMRVFFSRISLEDKLGQDYEPCIFAALNSAKVMLMVTTDSDHCDAVWVKNEWKRYLDFMESDPTKTLIPVYKDISPYTLPDEFSRFQAQDMGKLGAIQDLVRGVEKLTGKNKKTGKGGMSDEEKKALNAVQRGQRNTRFAIFALLLFFAGFFAVGFSIEAHDRDAFMHWPVLENARQLIEVYDAWDFSTAMVAALLVLPMVGVAAYLSHGLKSTMPRWIFFTIYLLTSAFMIAAQVVGFSIGFVLWGYFSIQGILSAISTLLAYRKDKKKMGVHFSIMAVLLAMIFVAGLL